MERGREWRERVVAWGIVALVHLAIGEWLLHWRTAGDSIVIDEALQVEFVVRRASARAVPDFKGVRRQRAERVGRAQVVQAPRDAAGPSRPALDATAQHEVDPGDARTLDLRVPEGEPPPVVLDPLQRAPALEFTDTRFSHAWVPAGNALQQAGFRSRAVGVALAAFGGPPRRCTEIERRLRRPNCLQLHGQEADDEALRAAADR